AAVDRDKSRPPDNPPRQHPPGAEAVTQPPAGNLHDRVTQDKSAKDPAHLHIAEPVLRHDVLGGDRDVHPVDEHQHAHAKDQGYDEPTNTGRGCSHAPLALRWFSSTERYEGEGDRDRKKTETEIEIEPAPFPSLSLSHFSV